MKILAPGSRLLAPSIRSLLRSPGFTAAAVLTLALGIGANTAIFSVVDAVLLRPLPYPDSERLVMVWDKLAKYNLPRRSPEYHTAAAYRRLDNIFDANGGIFGTDRTLTGDAAAERIPSMLVSQDVFQMLAPQTVLGRLFTPEEYRSGAEPVAILGHSLYLRRFGGDPAILGRSIALDNRSYRVVGVLSPFFEFSLTGPIDVWLPHYLDNPRNWGNATRMIARLRPGVSLVSAQAALSAAAKHVDETEHPYAGRHGEDAGYGVTVVTLHDQLLGQFRTVTLILLSAVAAVLLIACVNVANLLLVRAVSREKETAVRRALGATGARLMVQWLTESAMLSLMGGALGSIAAVWGVKILVALSPSRLPGVVKIGVDARALAFTFAISCLVCVLFGLAPAFASARMSSGTRGATRPSRQAASFLITMEVALAVMLMIGAGLLLKSFSRLTHVDTGFNPSHLLTMRVQASHPLTMLQIQTFCREVRERLAALPGVTSATVGGLPVRPGGVNAGSGDPFGIKGKSYDTATGPVSQFATLTEAGLDYFRTFEIPLRAGRTFIEADTADGPPVVIVNETLARAFFPQGAIGEQIGLPPPCVDTRCDFVWSTIVGVAGDVKNVGLDRAAKPQIYYPHAASGGMILRASGDPMLQAHAVAAAVHSIAPDMPVFDIRTMEDRMSDNLGLPRFETALLAFFAAAALFLAAIGIFAVVAHSTAQRTQEIGIRMALGADRGRVVQTVLFDGLRPVLLGVVLGLAGALAFSRILASVLFNVAATDPSTFLLAAALLTVVAIAACLGPAQRATKVDPMIALRSE